MDTIRIGIVGAGGNTRNRHIPNLQKIDGVEIAAVCNRSAASGQKAAEQFGIPKVYTNWRELVESDKIDAVVIGTWPNQHCPVTCVAFDAGKHVLCEARMARNADEAHDMLAARREHPELVGQIVPSPFTLKYDRAIQHYLADGHVGELLTIDVRAVGRSFPDFDAPLSWRQDRELSGFNTLALGIFYEALARWVGHAARVTAMTRTVVSRREQDGVKRVVDIPDHVDVLAAMVCGAQARMQFSAVQGLTERQRYIRLSGSEGVLELDLDQDCLRGGRRGEETLTPLELPEDLLGRWRVEEEFIGAVRGREPVKRTTFEDAVRYMEFTEAVIRSAAEGQVIALPL